MNKILWAAILLLLLCAGTANAQLEHTPYGNNEQYDRREVAHILWEREPHAPIAGERVTLYAKSEGIKRDHRVFLLWDIKGIQQETISCSRYMETSGFTIFRAKLPAFQLGDRVSYQFFDEKGQTEVFSFTVLDWQNGGCTVIQAAQNTRAVLCDPKGEDRLPGNAQIRYLTDGEDQLYACEIKIPARKDDQFLGFGMRYNSLDQRGQIIDHYTVNWYGDQREKAYATVPFFLCNGRYGFYAATDAYVQFDLAKTAPDFVRIYIELQNQPCVVYGFTGTNEEISEQYANTSGHAASLPDWAYGVWLSANEWNKQSEAEEQLRLARENGIDAAVLVLEAWSDEATFYRFSQAFPAPKALVDEAHAQGARVLLWQIPVLKYTAEGNVYSRADELEAIQKGYVIRNADGTPYRMPEGWFGGSLLLDFTNRDAVSWFLSKRAYLVDEIGIDGFKTDGGEFIWGQDTTAANGLSGRMLRNAYPDLYALSYQDELDTLTFSRAAGKNAAQHSVLWAGDQTSTFDEFQGCIRAILNMNLSGMPFVTFDIAGFAGELPTSELYQRAVAFAAFTPVMQVHSEAAGDPVPSQARTPWNMAQRRQDPMCLSTFQKYAAINAALRPYMQQQAGLSCQTGVPFLRTMAYAFPNDKIACQTDFQFMLGEKYLVAPVVEPRVSTWKVYLPQGTWRHYFTDEVYSGGRYILCSAQVDEIPVFERMDER